jgi:hypothetical protein
LESRSPDPVAEAAQKAAAQAATVQVLERPNYLLQLTTLHDMIVIAATKRGVGFGIHDALGGLPCEAGYTTIAGKYKEVWRYVNSSRSVHRRCRAA